MAEFQDCKGNALKTGFYEWMGDSNSICYVDLKKGVIENPNMVRQLSEYLKVVQESPKLLRLNKGNVRIGIIPCNASEYIRQYEENIRFINSKLEQLANQPQQEKPAEQTKEE